MQSWIVAGCPTPDARKKWTASGIRAYTTPCSRYHLTVSANHSSGGV